VAGPELQVRLGLDDREFVRELGRAEREAGRSLERMRRDNERHEADRRRAADETARRRADNFRKVGRGAQVAAVGIAAGSALIANAYAAAAERSDEIARGLERARAEGRGLLADIGEDLNRLFPVEQQGRFIAGFREARDAATDFLGNAGRSLLFDGFGGGGPESLKNLQRQEAAQRELDRQQSAGDSFRSIRRRLTIEAPGDSDAAKRAALEARVAASLEETLKSINRAQQEAGLTNEQVAELREMARNNAAGTLADDDARVAAERDARSRSFGRAADDAALGLRLARAQGSAAGATGAERAGFELEANEIRRHQETLAVQREIADAEYDRVQAAEMLAARLGEVNARYDAQRDAIERAREAERQREIQARRDARESLDERLERLEIDELAARGADEEAQRRRIELDFARQIRDVQRDERLDQSTRDAAVGRLERFRDLALGRVGEREGSSRAVNASVAAQLGPALAGGPELQKQQLAEAQGQTNILKEIRDNTAAGGVAVAG
jgi:hypothetical protein